MSPKKEDNPPTVNPRGTFYEWGTPEEEKAKHLERIRLAGERKAKKEQDKKDKGIRDAG